ncbi:MAG: acetate--CoA ligase [Dehalococcoidales bacterium]|nr:acetate--CoA ligase [Dehalococcoidales bacterium]
MPEGGITSMMEEKRIFPSPKEFSKKAYIKSMDEYKKIYQRSVDDPEGFWAEMAQDLDWYKKWNKVLVEDFAKAKHSWFVGGKINVSYNCLDRHCKTWRRNKAAIIWQGEPLGETRTLTYQQLYYEVNKFANVLKKMGIKKGDRVCIYLPMIPELAISMLACARIGAIHTIVFGGFSAEALRDRIADSTACLLICTDGYYRNGKTIANKAGADTAMAANPCIKNAIVVKRAGCEVTMQEGRDLWWHDLMADPDIKAECEPEVLDAEDPLFILYTSGSTGKPKGVLHTQAGYLMYAYQTSKWIFDLKDEDIHWCTADIGWITGHTYIVYGPLSNGATSLMFESVPTYPKPDRFWEIIEKFKVSIFYTAPTVIRSLMRESIDYINSHDLSSLRLLGSVGEPINPEVWIWYYENIGKSKCPLVDTWWQTETGGILISPLPGAVPQKPGSATVPFPGCVPAILRADGSPAEVNEGGYLVIKRPWPGLMRRIWGDEKDDPKLFQEKYFVQFPGVYTVGDGARVDEDGYYWLMGRIDDVIKVSGHRIGTAEVESALVSHASVAEAAVVGMPHSIKGEGIYAYVTLKAGVTGTDELKKELVTHVRKVIGPIASPDKIQYAEGLPKTRSGKIMRRILVKIAAGDTGNLGDTSTLADPAVVDSLIKGKQ